MEETNTGRLINMTWTMKLAFAADWAIVGALSKDSAAACVKFRSKIMRLQGGRKVIKE